MTGLKALGDVGGLGDLGNQCGIGVLGGLGYDEVVACGSITFQSKTV